MSPAKTADGITRDSLASSINDGWITVYTLLNQLEGADAEVTRALVLAATLTMDDMGADVVKLRALAEGTPAG